METETNLIVRKAEPNDLSAILEIEYLSFAEDSFSKSQFIYLMTRGKGPFYIVQAGDKVVAYLSLSFHSRTRNLRIYSIAVHPECRGMKVGQRLMDLTFGFAKECQARKITLEVKVTNDPAIGLYKKNGFEATHLKCNYYHDGSDAYYMQRPVSEE